MSTSHCDPSGVCPRCGYANGPRADRCVRCRSILVVMQGCTGACAKCLAAAPQPAGSCRPPAEGLVDHR